jgi:glycosyltransferase involved in cell wall biosynthesis
LIFEKKRKINVLFIMMQMEMGGSERLVHNLVLKMDRHEFNPSIAWFFGNKILKEFQDLNVPLYHVPKLKRIDFSTMAKLEEIIRDNNIHIVNAHHFMSMVYAFYGCKIRKRAKLIYTEHSAWEIEHISWKWRTAGNYLLRHTDAAVGVSEAVANQIKKKFNPSNSKIHTIQNGVDLETDVSGIDRDIIRKRLGLVNNEKIIGTVANFKKIKNHIFLLKAFNELIKEYKNVKLLLIGQGFEADSENTEKELKDFVQEKGLSNNILFLGYRPDIPALLSIMDIFCLTSFKEGLPISLIEAMATSLPIVGTDVDGIRDILIDNKNGLLVQIGDVIGLKNALLSLLKNNLLRERLGKESKTLAKSMYSLNYCVKKYQDLFISL